MAAIHTWKGGIKWWQEMRRTLEPFPNIHLVNEAYGADMGWARSPMAQAQLMMTEKLDMPIPSWLTQEEYCKLDPYNERR